MSRRTTSLAGLLLLLTAASACSEQPPAADPDRIVLKPAADGAGHSHAPGQEHSAQGPLGDGTQSSVGGYRIADVRLPGADRAGDLSFRILGRDGAPVTEYVEEQTKLLHLYVVRADLSAFRHVHPELGADGTWRARVDLGQPGRWRVVAELTPQGESRPHVLGTSVAVPAPAGVERVAAPQGRAATGADGVVEVRVLGRGSVGDDGRLRLAVTDTAGEPLTLGSYLGASAHLTGFALGSRGFVHVHPYGAPEVRDDGTVLTFHTTFTEAGDYRLFVQVRVEGLLHQVAVTVTVDPSTPSEENP